MHTWHRTLASFTFTINIVGIVGVLSRKKYMLGAHIADGLSVATVVPVPMIVTVQTMAKQMTLSFPTILMTFHNSKVRHIQSDFFAATK